MHGLNLIKIEETGILQSSKKWELVDWLDVYGKFRSYLQECDRESIKVKASLGCTDRTAVRSVREFEVQSESSGDFCFPCQ